MIVVRMPQITYLVLNIFIATCIIFISLRKINIQERNSILFLSSAALLCYTAKLIYFFFPTDLMMRIIPAVIYFLGELAVTALFVFSLEYAKRPHSILRYIYFLFAVFAIITQVLYWFPDINMLFQKQVNPLSTLSDFTFLEKFNSLYYYSLLAASVGLLVSFLRSSKSRLSGRFYFRIFTIIYGPLVALIDQGFLLLGMSWHWLEPIFLISLNQIALGFAYDSLQEYSISRLLVRREDIVEKLEDGWLITDAKNIIIDYNQAALKILRLAGKKQQGKSLASLLNDFPNLVDVLSKDYEVEMDKTLKINDEFRYLNFRVLNLKNSEGIILGRLVLARDITDRRRAEDSRQQARDEMFVLLNAIANAASESATLSEFLLDAIYQIVYPFRSQSVFIYLLDDKANFPKKEEFHLVAHLGIADEDLKMMKKLNSSITLFKWLEENRQALFLEDPQDYRIPESIRALGMLYILVIPLLIQTHDGQKIIGHLFLSRKIKIPYKPDEIVRLTILSDQIASLIDSDRRRKLSITLSERQRLMRDIHDSVSQKLYGLVTLTEAAQAAEEAGSQPDYHQILLRISENARQAVKELRLFLFQMQPIDLEKEGLISVLHHRLTAVEGRADIKARFLADENISLSKRKEVALYYIAQEALNNVLRHAKANSVDVILKQGYKYVTLEIIDDGCGFDNTNLDRGGLGLKNMVERVKQENGKIKISSKPGEGTIIKVTFEKMMNVN